MHPPIPISVARDSFWRPILLQCLNRSAPAADLWAEVVGVVGVRVEAGEPAEQVVAGLVGRAEQVAAAVGVEEQEAPAELAAQAEAAAAPAHLEARVAERAAAVVQSQTRTATTPIRPITTPATW